MLSSRPRASFGHCLALVFCCAILSSSAQNLEDAQLLFDSGRFLKAAEMRAALGEGYEESGDTERASMSLSLAAWAFAIHGQHSAPDNKKQKFYKRAEEVAERAIGLNPSDSDAYFQLGFALTLVSQDKLFKALSNRQRIRQAFERAIELNPQSVGAHIGLADWHAVNIAATKAIPWLNWGNRNLAIEHYQEALRLAPEQSGVHLEYGKGLLLLDTFDIKGRFHGCDNSNAVQSAVRARQHLILAVRLITESAYSQLQCDEATSLLEKLDTHHCLAAIESSDSFSDACRRRQSSPQR